MTSADIRINTYVLLGKVRIKILHWGKACLFRHKDIITTCIANGDVVTSEAPFQKCQNVKQSWQCRKCLMSTRIIDSFLEIINKNN